MKAKVIRNSISILDDPFVHKNFFGEYDDEGNKRSIKNLILNGILNDVLADSVAAKLQNAMPGNAANSYFTNTVNISESTVRIEFENPNNVQIEYDINIIHSFPQQFSYNSLSGQITMLLGGINKDDGKYNYYTMNINIIKFLECIVYVEELCLPLDSYYLPNIIINFKSLDFLKFK